MNEKNAADLITESLSERPQLDFVQGLLEDFPDGEVYLVGGAVRDALLARESQDFDFVIRGVPSGELEDWLSRRGQVDFVGRNFGVYKFLPSGFDAARCDFIDIALPRTEETVRDSRGGYRDFEVATHPFLPILYDLERRDFTINAIAYDLREKTIFDPFNGQKDLARRMIRCVGEPTARFTEDLSRMLRAMRFAVQLDFTIGPKAWSAILANITRINERRVTDPRLMDRMLGRQNDFVVPRETIGKELIKSLGISAAKTFELWQESGALKILLPELEQYLFTGEGSGLAEIDELTRGHFAARLASILAPLGLVRAAQVFDDYALSGVGPMSIFYVEKQHLNNLITGTEFFLNHEPTKLPAHLFEKFFMAAWSDELILTIESSVKLARTDQRSAFENRLRETRVRRLDIYSRLDVAPGEEILRLLNGEEIMTLKKIKAGPKVGQLANLLRDAQLDGQVTSKEQAIQFLQNN